MEELPASNPLKALPETYSFFTLPAEIRVHIYVLLLQSSCPTIKTWGNGTGICTKILRTCRLIHDEAAHFLYLPNHLIKAYTANTVAQLQADIPAYALRRMQHLTVQVTFATINRGNCETSIEVARDFCTFSETLGFSLRHSQELKSLRIVLLNWRQRGRAGPKPLRLPVVREQMHNMLLPFAYLPERVEDVEVGGFDAIEWTEMFAEMREKCKGRELPFEQMMEEALAISKEEYENSFQRLSIC